MIIQNVRAVIVAIMMIIKFLIIVIEVMIEVIFYSLKFFKTIFL